MKVGIMTYYDPYNFGAVLQAHALQQVLAGFGMEPEIIAYDRKKFGRSRSETLAAKRVPLWQRVVGKYYWMRFDGLSVRKRRYDEFRANSLSISDSRYASEQELRERPPDYDAFVCGSDQIWNPYHPSFSCVYLLDFAPRGRPRTRECPRAG